MQDIDSGFWMYYRYSDDPEQVGRKCESCSSDYCSKRGDCRIESGQKVCECKGSYYGTRCEIDGEVLGVAVGASVAAVVIIILTLIFLCMWSRRWKAQDRKTEVLARGATAAGLTIGGGFSVNVQHKGGTLPPNQYGISMEDRMRWAQIAESISNQNLYAQHFQESGSGAVYSANSNEYLTSAATSNPYSVYNRVTRAISNSTIGRGGRGHGGFLYKLRGLLGRTSKTRKKDGRVPSYMMTSHPTLNFQQLMALHAQLSANASRQWGDKEDNDRRSGDGASLRLLYTNADGLAGSVTSNPETSPRPCPQMRIVRTGGLPVQSTRKG
ncbi:hypothetical protein SK128_011481 [Halocaridina rubra]|uniref:EGF-like domain-containing protein n=1 Tax=Halocaridina rubra TaxID=373956 RepID=A0AAN9A9B5_HALRR